MKLLVCDPTAPTAIEAMRDAGIEVDVQDDVSAEDLERIIAGYEAMIVRSRTQVPASLIDKADNLKLVIRAGVGIDNIDVAHANTRGIEVRNTAEAPSNSVAELTLGYMFALARQIPQATASLKAGEWDKKRFSQGIELAGKTLGLVGCGRIGSLLAGKALVLGMEVLYHDIESVDVPGAHPVSLEQVLTRSHFISLHVPCTPATRHIIGADEIALMKDGVYIINVGRGGTLDEEALYQAIVSGKVGGAALDVFEDEKVDRGNKLMALPQVIGSPHVGSGTGEAKQRVGEQVARLAIEFASNHR